MGLALEVVDTFRTAGGADAAPVASVVYSGDVLTVRSFDPPSKAAMTNLWTVAATDGIARVRSPRLHDNVQGIQVRMDGATGSRDLFTEYDEQVLYTQDTIIAEVQAGAAETDGLSYLVHYENLGGVDARLVMFDAIKSRIVNLVNVTVANAAGIAIGNRSVSAALNATSDLLKGNTDYALLGYEVDVPGQSVGIRGPDTGNLRLGGPATTERMETRDWFIRVGDRSGRPSVPIIDSANKAGTFVDNCQVVVGLAMNVTLVMAELSS